MWWPELNSSVQQQMNLSSQSKIENKRDQRDMLEEMLAILRNMSNQALSPIHGDLVNSRFLSHISDTWRKITQAYISDDSAQLYRALLDLYSILNFLVDNSNTVNSTRQKFLDSISELLTQLTQYYDKAVAPLQPKTETTKLGSLEALRQRIKSEGK
jgi:hypothetical protein